MQKPRGVSDRPDAAGDQPVPSFEDRVVAYVDILGFREVVKAAQNDVKLFALIRDVLTTIEQQVRRFEHDREHRSALDPAAKFLWDPPAAEMTAFSDCYLISDQPSRAWTVFAAVQALGSGLLSHNILTRGAVVFGPAYHSGQIAFGPAICEAYDVERKQARFPRIVVSDQARAEIEWENEWMWHNRLLRRDDDGRSFINVLTPPISRWASLSETPSVTAGDTNGFLAPIRSFLLRRLQDAAGTPDHFEKVSWLSRQFNCAALEFESAEIPEDAIAEKT